MNGTESKAEKQTSTCITNISEGAKNTQWWKNDQYSINSAVNLCSVIQALLIHVYSIGRVDSS